MANPYDEDYGIGGGGDPNPYDDEPTVPPEIGGHDRAPQALSLTPREVDQDVAKSVLTGAKNFATGTLGLPGMVEEYAGKGVNAIAKAAGSNYQYPRMLPNQEEINTGLQSVTGKVAPRLQDYLFHEPKTNMGKAMEVGTEILPSFVGLGSGGMRAAERARALANGPTGQQLAQATTQAYQRLRNANLVYEADDYRRATAALQRDLRTYPHQGPSATLLNDIIGDARMRMPGDRGPEFEQLELLRRRATDIVHSRSLETTNSERTAAGIIARRLDHFRDNAMMTSGSIPRNQAMQLQREARDLAHRNIKSHEIETIQANAEAVTPENYRSTLKTQINAILRNPHRRAAYTEGEQNALRRSAQIGTMEGMFSGGGPFASVIRQGISSVVGGSLGGGLGAGVTMAATAAAEHGIRAIANARRARALGQAGAEIRAGAANVPALVPANRARNALLLSGGYPAAIAPYLEEQ